MRPNVVIVCASDIGNEVHEVTVGGLEFVDARLRDIVDWRRCLMPQHNLVAVASTHPCTMAVQGEPYAEMLHWASEEH